MIPKTTTKTNPRPVKGSVQEHNVSDQQKKRKQVRQSWEEEKSDGSFDHTEDMEEMAIVLARLNDDDICTEVEEQESIKETKNGL